MLRRLLILLSLVATAALAPCGSFVLDDGSGHAQPTGGTEVINAPPPPYGPSTNYQLTSDGWWYGQGSGPSAQCSGTVHYHWRWTGTGADVAPPSVVLKVEADAQYGSSTSGACDDGLTPTP